VAFVVATSDVDENTTRSRVWLDDAPLTAGDHDANPVWSPDGRFLAFTSRRGEKKGDSTLHIVPITASGEVRTVCTMPDGLGNVTWSPDGRWIAFTSRTRDKRYEEKDESWQAPRKVERFLSRLNGENWIFDRPAHVYVVPVDGSRPPRNLTPGPFQHDGIAWTPDGTGIVTSAQRHDIEPARVFLRFGDAFFHTIVRAHITTENKRARRRQTLLLIQSWEGKGF